MRLASACVRRAGSAETVSPEGMSASMAVGRAATSAARSISHALDPPGLGIVEQVADQRVHAPKLRFDLGADVRRRAGGGHRDDVHGIAEVVRDGRGEHADLGQPLAFGGGAAARDRLDGLRFQRVQRLDDAARTRRREVGVAGATPAPSFSISSLPAMRSASSALAASENSARQRAISDASSRPPG